ncbi:FAD-dependent oxidoreductase [Coraliomargarita algicola]|uniref:FAD-dependent oxidoreductase n=1 Tax=Coraliomargarita algicola TaxID=3092156 RepID=A0ABZ0RHY8_9BACT|nr:FAD-dependent oxidoreductase [Coraliomargarita sp. J2-16]WPJ95801.1 FAD-dependent oxidoreductase [Coraliomargarita sp. J2-16]
MIQAESFQPNDDQAPKRSAARTFKTDICVYGGNSGGVIAALTARKNGQTVTLLEPSNHLGGLTSGGLGYSDIGNKFAIGGLARQFYERMGKKYGQDEAWLFEPQVARSVFEEWLDEMNIVCHFGSFLDTVQMHQGRIKQITTLNGITVQAKQFIDTSYEGDLMAKAGVSYTVGREDNDVYGETYNGQQMLDKHQFNFDVDPYIVPGDPASGLLPGIDDGPYQQGKGDHRVQAYNFRLCLTDDATKRVPFTQPENYNPADYELLRRYCQAGYIPEFDKFDRLVNDVYDMNNWGAISSDYIGMNHDYPEASYAEREKIFQAHVTWTKGLLWFWLTDPSVDKSFQNRFRTFGWNAEAFKESDHFPPALYVREARRMVSDVVMTEHHCTGYEIISDAIGLAAYVMDSHNCRRIVVDGKVRNEGDVQIHSGPPYPISYQCIVPKRGECTNLFVPYCLSASHIAFGSIRMEPVFMILAQSAVEAATIAIKNRVDVQAVSYTKLKSRLRQVNQIVEPVPMVNDIQAGE